MHDSQLSREVIRFFFLFAALVAPALLIDAVLHVFDAVWVGRYLGIPGTLLILGSFGYLLRKRKLISTGKPANLLRLREAMAWLGSLLVRAGAVSKTMQAVTAFLRGCLRKATTAGS